jgi:hypothetical protein
MGIVGAGRVWGRDDGGDGELAALLDFVARAHRINKEATARLRATTPARRTRRRDAVEG